MKRNTLGFILGTLRLASAQKICDSMNMGGLCNGGGVGDGWAERD